MSRSADIVIVGAGMAGASLAAEVASHASILLLEAEAQPGYHATGRSAAFWSETYGGPLVQPLTSASRSFLACPPPDFAERSFLAPRGALYIANARGMAALAILGEQYVDSSVRVRELGPTEIAALVPGIRSGWDAALHEPGCSDIDASALHAAYLKAARRGGAELVTGARVEAAERRDGLWRVKTAAGEIEARILVNAAGAWADELSLLAGAEPFGIQAYRRTIAQLRTSPGAPADLPLVIDASERFYFKPEAGGRLWLSPHDETPCHPCDAAADQYDIAVAVDRLEQVLDWKVERIEHSWAGLRSFTPDRLPVYGFDPKVDGFFWCAGQGGFGIQTAPAAAKLAASLLLGTAPDPMVSAIDPAPYLAGRFTN